MRHYTEQSFQHGYAVQGYTDTTAHLDIQPAGDPAASSEAGFHNNLRLTVYGDYPFTPADQERGVKGDRVLWYGRWYECNSSQYWDITPLHHYISTFVVVPDGGDDL